MSEASITGEQSKAARKLLGWSQMSLAGYVGVSELAIGAFERKGRRYSVLCLDRLRKTFEDAGVEFLDGERPRIRTSAPATRD
jgi:transcriptional regulator with XRE-family HTH domain